MCISHIGDLKLQVRTQDQPLFHAVIILISHPQILSAFSVCIACTEFCDWKLLKQYICWLQSQKISIPYVIYEASCSLPMKINLCISEKKKEADRDMSQLSLARQGIPNGLVIIRNSRKGLSHVPFQTTIIKYRAFRFSIFYNIGKQMQLDNSTNPRNLFSTDYLKKLVSKMIRA